MAKYADTLLRGFAILVSGTNYQTYTTFAVM